MTKHTCLPCHLKPFEGGRICYVCGSLHLDEIKPMATPPRVQTIMERRPQLNTREAKAASRLYIVSVYDHIQQSLDAGRTRAWIDESLDGREYAIDPKTLMTKFKEEKARRAV